MRLLNVRLAIILLVAGLTLGGGAYLLHRVQNNRHASTFLKAAEAANDEKNPRLAIERMYHYLNLMPGDMDAKEKLGLWQAEVMNYTAAYQILEELLRIEGQQKRTDARRKLIEVTMGLGRLPDAEHHIQVLLEDFPKDADLLIRLGQCQVVLGKDQEGVATFKKAIKLAPKQIETYMLLAQVLRLHLNNPTEADKCMEEMIRLNPKSAKAHVLYGQHLFTPNSIDAAMKEAKTALELSPEDITALILAGQCCLERQKFDEAADFANRVVKAAKDNAAGYLLLADIKLKTGRTAEAIATLKEGMEAAKKTGGYGQLLLQIANTYLESGNIPEAQKLIQEMRRIKFPEAYIICLSARVEQLQGHWTKARNMYESVRKDLLPTPGLLKYVDYWTGQCYGQAGQVEQQLVAYRRAVAVDPFFYVARLAIAEILGNTGDSDGSIEEYRQAMKSGKKSEQLIIPLCRALLVKTLSQQPAERNWDELAAALEKARALAPNSVDVALFHAEYLVARNRMEEAEQLLTALRDRLPNRAEGWLSLAGLAERQEKWDQAETYIKGAEENLGDRVTVRLARGQYLIKRYGTEGGPQLKKLAENCQGFPTDEQLRLWNGLALQAIQVNDLDTAMFICKKVAAQEPNNIRVRQLMFEMTCKDTRDIPKTLVELRRILAEIETIAGKGPFWLYGQAALLIFESKGNPEALAKAKQYIHDAREMRPTWSRLPRLAGRICEVENELDKAIENYLQAITLGEHDADVIRSVIRLMAMRQRMSEADGLLRRLSEQQVPLTSEIYHVWVQIALQLRDVDEVLKVAAKAVREDSPRYEDHLWLGRVYATLAQQAKEDKKPEIEIQNRDRAEKTYRKALAIQPTSQDSWVALVQLLATTGQKDKARAAIAQAEATLPRLEASLTLAHCYEALGDLETAAEKYHVALMSFRNNPKVIQNAAEFYIRTGNGALAEPLLRSLIDGKDKIEEVYVIWARQVLARYLLETGTFQNLTEALHLIDENLASRHATSLDRRIKARLLLAHPQRAKNREAVTTLETMMQNGESVDADDYFELAQRYRAQGNWEKYRTYMLNVLSSPNPNPRHLVSHIRAVLQNEDARDAEYWLERAESYIHDDFLKVTFRADILALRRQFEQGMKLLMDYIEGPDRNSKERGEHMAYVASALEHWATRLNEANALAAASDGKTPVNMQDKATAARLLQKAETLYRSYVGQQPSKKLVLAMFLARQDRLSEALDLIDLSWPETSPEVTAMVSWFVLRNEQATTDQILRIQRVLDSASKKANRPLCLEMPLAYSYSIQGRYQEAEGLYRDALAKKPNDPNILNDLAILLALQGKNLDESLRLITRAIELAGPVAAMLDSRATIYVAREQADKAAEDIDAAVADDPSAIHLFHKARVCLLAGKKTEAAEVLAAAKKKGLKRSMLDPAERPIFDKMNGNA